MRQAVPCPISSGSLVPARSLSLGAVGLAAATTLFLLSTVAPSTAPSDAVERVGAEFDAMLRENAAGLHGRIATIAELPRLANAVATDARTVQNLTNEELAFRTRPGETIEIGQITNAGAVVSLLRIPSDGPAAPPLDKTGPALAAADNGLLISEVVAITPSQTTEVQRGAIAVSWRIDGDTLRSKLEALGEPVRLEFRGRVIAAQGSPAMPVLAHANASGLTLITAAHEAPFWSPLRIASAAVAAATLLLSALFWRRSPPARTSTPLPVVGQPASPGGLAASSGSMGVTEFGRYQLIRKLGSGGMAEVFLARVLGEAGFAKEVALKIMHQNLAKQPEVVDHFLDEARLATRLNHPNIVQIIDLGRQGDDYFIAMEFVDGYDLNTLLDSCQQRNQPVPARIALTIARKICDGLHAAHTAVTAEGAPLDLVHRDVKAENVLISRKGEVKVADFGIAKANQRSRQTQLGMVKGTAAYMAPEHRLGKPVDRRADVYGVGAILYELLAGTAINLDLETLAHLGVEGWPHLTPISQLRAEMPPDIDTLVFTALAYDREDRYANCAAFEEALDRFASEHDLLGTEKMLVQWLEKQLAALEAA